MRVLHVIAGISPKAGGPTRSVKGLTSALAARGLEVALFAHSPSGGWDDRGDVGLMQGTTLSGWRAKTEFERALLTFRPDVVHVHGLWSTHWDVASAVKCGMPVVLSPRGMLDPWALSVKRWKKRLAMLLYQKKDLCRVAAFHATAQEEAEHIRAQGLLQPIIISPNGVECPSEVLADRPIVAEKATRTAVFLGRLHPGKGLLTLAEAWARVRPQGWTMRVIGPDAYGHKAEVLARLRKLGIEGEWTFCDMVDDQLKWKEYADADLLVHPSVSENFGITIAEGLAAGLPVICTKGTPWREIVGGEAACAGWWVDQGVDALTMALRMSTEKGPDELLRMGRNGQRLIKSRYLWPAVVEPMLKGYEQLLCGGRERFK